MRIAIGRKGAYALSAAIHLARHSARHQDGSRLKAREIAEALAVPEAFLLRILSGLASAGILTAVSGRGGGYSLAADPADVSLLDIIEAAEGPVPSGRCLLSDGPCDPATACDMHTTWARAQHTLSDQLVATTLATILAERTR
jgi:Rrf2 family protein